MTTLAEVLDRSAAERRPTQDIAAEIARERLGTLSPIAGERAG